MPVQQNVHIAPAEGRLGVLIPGMGAVSTTFMAGVEAVKRSSLEWVVVRAPRLGDGPPRKQFRHGYIKPKFTAMSREDVADFVLKQVTSNDYLRKLPIVSY